MSLTISELESERAKILEEIENKAQTLSNGKPNMSETHSLNDWLKAAEEVMPTSAPGRNKETMRIKENRSNYSAQMLKPSKNKNKASFFGVIIMLSLLLTLLGVLYIAYTSMHKELQAVLVKHQQNVEQMALLQSDMANLQKAITTGGKAELFISLEDKVFALEAQVLKLQTQLQSKTLSMTEVQEGAKLKPSATTGMVTTVKPEISANKVVTEAVLDQKLRNYTDQLERKIDDKLQTILNYLSKNKPVSQIVNSKAQVPVISEKNSVVEPKVTAPTTPVITQPLVKLLQPVESAKPPLEPTQTQAPLKQFTADVKWLMEQPERHYTLQLASMPEQHSLEKMVETKQLTDVKIVPQTRNSTTNYVLIMGAFAERKSADDLARKIKSEFGISPWVRKVKDITARIQ